MHPKDQESLTKDLLSIVQLFDENGVDYALCGGFAVAIHGYVRATQDIDLIIYPEDLDKVKKLLEDIEYNLSSGIIPFKQPNGSFREIVRVNKAVGDHLYTVDLMLCTGSLEKIWEDRRIVYSDHVELKVVSKESLIEMKKEAGRGKDLIDIQELESNGEA